MINYESGSVDINIDYTKFENFINFSSAEERLKNFKYKLDLIEGYDDKVNELSGLRNFINGGGKLFLAQGKINTDLKTWQGSVKQSNIVKILNSSGTTSNNLSKISLDSKTAINQTKVLKNIVSEFVGVIHSPFI